MNRSTAHWFVKQPVGKKKQTEIPLLFSLHACIVVFLKFAINYHGIGLRTGVSRSLIVVIIKR